MWTYLQIFFSLSIVLVLSAASFLSKKGDTADDFVET